MIVTKTAILQVQLAGLWCVFEDPTLNAYQAAPIWNRTACADILPVTTGKPPLAAIQAIFPPNPMRCQMHALEERERQITHICFAEHGRQLQLEIQYQANSGPEILTPVIAPTSLLAKRSLAMRRLVDLVEHGCLREHLYPAESRGARFARILQALDGALAGVRYRDIAISLFGENRVAGDWALPNNHLRDHVRRAIAQGRMLASGGFVRLLA